MRKLGRREGIGLFIISLILLMGGVLVLEKTNQAAWVKPSASITSPISGSRFNVGQIITFTARTNYEFGAIRYYKWNFGDGRSSTTVAPTVQYAYSQGGMRTVNLTVQASNGLWSMPAVVRIYVQELTPPKTSTPAPTTPTPSPLPTVIPSPSPYSHPTAYIDTPSNSMVFNINTPIQFNGSGTTPYGIVDGYKWQFGDGSIGSSSTMNHTYTSDGTKIVNFYVKNSVGIWSDPASVIITIVATKPVATISQPADNQEYFLKSEIPFSGIGTTSSGVIVEFMWSFGDGMTSNAMNPIHIYDSVGKKTVTLRVKNSYGLWSDNVTISINIVEPISNQYSQTHGITATLDSLLQLFPTGMVRVLILLGVVAVILILVFVFANGGWRK